MLLQFVLSVGTETVNLNNLPILDEFKEQCQPKRAFVDSSFKLSQLVVVFRHGDRAPLKLSGSQWDDKQCKSCSDGCVTKKCAEGMLTLKGFSQAEELGRFISKFYVPKFSTLGEIRGFHSKIERTATTLSGVIQGIGLTQPKIGVEASLVNNPNSTQVKGILSKQSSSNGGKGVSGNYYIYDNLMTSMCSNIPFDCSSFSCRPEKIHDLMKNQEGQFIEGIERTRINLVANGVSLGKFGSFLEKIVSSRNSIVLISGHDSTLIKLLIGLNIKLDKIPAYSSAAFLEVWKQPSGKEFIRVVYNGKVQKIGLYGEENVEVEKFMTYLAMFNKLNGVLNSNTDINSENIKSFQKLNEIAQSATRIYKPLLMELKSKGIIQDFSFLSEGPEASPEAGLRRALKSLVVPMKQFLFEGWFSGSSKKGKTDKIEIKVEMKDKDTGKTKYQIIECDKNGKGNCRAVSNSKDEKKSKPTEICVPDSSSKKQESCGCEADKPSRCDVEKEAECGCTGEKTGKYDMEKDSMSPSCQVKAMLEGCGAKATPCREKKATCEKKKTPCEAASASAFDGLPGTCKMFPNRSCEVLTPPVPPTPCTRKQSPILPDGSCRNPMPGVEILG